MLSLRLGIALIVAAAAPPAAADSGLPLARWSFDATAVSEDPVLGHAWRVQGVVGDALQLDGITAHLRRPAERVPALPASFTLEAFVALAAYPFNWAPLLQQQDARGGFFLGIGDEGQVGFRVTVGGRTIEVESSERLQLRRWAHVVAVFEQGRGARLYVDGALAGSTASEGGFEQAKTADLWIGRNAFELEQTAPVGSGRQLPSRIFLDGILDEVAIRAGVPSAAEVAQSYARTKPGTPPPLEQRSLPRVPPGMAPFGALQTRLRYYRGWDDYWRFDGEPDVVVRFDRFPFWFTFWRGTSYIPHWVTENGIWYDNEFTETFPPGLVGSAEPMSDKQCRYSQVRVLESSDARVVVHWRYAPVGVGYRPAWEDPQSGWFDWTDEFHTIYPDGVGVRKIVAHTSRPDAGREWHEGIVVMGPGTTPNDALEPVGLTLANSRGESVDVSWEKATPPKDPPQPPRAGIQRVNTRSRYRPFAIARVQDEPRWDVYAGEVRRDVSIYPWWNHWPTAFEPSNGRYAKAADRASHSSLTHLYWKPYEATSESVTKIHLEGMSDRAIAELASLARSWEAPPPLALEGAGFTGGAYDPAQRAWLLRAPASGAAPLVLTLRASEGSPIEGVPLVIVGWGERDARLSVDGREVVRGEHFRFGHRRTLECSDLVVFLDLRATTPVRLQLLPR